MFYKRDDAFGIRRGFGDKRQIFSVGSKSLDLTKKRKIANTVLDYLLKFGEEGKAVALKDRLMQDALDGREAFDDID